MLKIKDDIDLKELEKFGFENIINETYYKEEENSGRIGTYETGIIINPLNRKINNQITYYIINLEDLEDVPEGDIDLTSELEILYDLIKADLIEKVEEK